MAALAPLIAGTQCPFAVRAQLRGAPEFNPRLSLRDNVEQSVAELVRFTRDAATELLDGFVLAFPVRYVGADLPDLGRLTRTLVEVLMAHDPVRPSRFHRAEVTGARWRLNFAGVDYFAPVFSPVYGSRHSRSTHGVTDTVFVLMQPDSSFHARLHPRGDRIRENIRSRFEQAECGYPLYQLEAHKFVLPHRVQDEPLRWYDIEIHEKERRTLPRHAQGTTRKSELHQVRRSRAHYSWC
ncbi:YqcI/YcgG family protein [Kitasatospora acidiphila]|uniref:YqcI/YcgG family protein n=1 Tax=Kitasatospora acidiphila TaxID=2567942 RepID=UPI0015F08914|nr:YqcI/YcgG family protein [Kitasatospora acidiphila]